jgi:hypothetical protein
MDTQKEAVIVIDDQRTALLVSAREAALVALYPDEPGGFGSVINIRLDPEMEFAEKRLARERERRRLMLADFDRVHPITDGDRLRMAKAEAKRARRRARNRS